MPKPLLSFHSALTDEGGAANAESPMAANASAGKNLWEWRIIHETSFVASEWHSAEYQVEIWNQIEE